MRKIILTGFSFFLLVHSGWAMSPSPLDQIEIAILQKDYQQVEQLSGALLENQDLDAEDRHKALYYLGLSQLNFDRYREAQATFQKLIDQVVDPVWRDRAYLGLYNAYFLNGDYIEALSVAEKLLAASPRSDFLSMIHLKIARAHLKLTNWSRARRHLQIVVDDFPRSLEVHLARQFLSEKQYFAVQVGSFQSKDRAAQLAAELGLKGEYAYIVETSDPRNQTFYRVRVGQLGNLSEAEQLRARLSDQGYPALVYP